MNVSCTSCSAKYAIPDEKVRGKKVKITCKHCGTGIIVDGTKLDAAGEPPAAAAPAVAAAAPAAAAPKVTAPAAVPAAASAAAAEVSFDIAYPDDRQETLRLGEIVDKYAAGTLDDEAFIWREGMSDWKAPFDIPEIASALSARGLKKKATPAAPIADDDETTRVQESPFDSLPIETSPGEWREPAKEAPSSPAAAFDLRAPAALPFEKPEPAPSPKPTATSPKPAAFVAMPKQDLPKPAAARRTEARGGGDLFGDLAAAGSEEDETLGSEAKEAAPKMTGARNESSVLFSLDALVKQEQKPTAKSSAAKQDDAAAILMGTDSGPSSIANVGIGSFGSAFAAPDFNAPVLAAPVETRASDPVELPTPAAAKKKGMGLWIGIAAVVALAGGAFAMGLPSKLAGTAPPPAPTPSATAAAAKPEAAPTATTEPAPTAAAASAAPTASTAPALAAGGAAAKPAAAVAKPETAPAKPGETPTKPAEKPAEKPAADASSAPPFDKAAAIAALSAAAGNAQSCKTPDGPGGSGKVSITFMPSGRATNTSVSGDLAGTAVGGCVARLFRSTKVPAFSGEAVTVSKSFSVQ
jgi:predicted Zn finger-like uncharacterized protein